jgi:gliding motility-associated-like protein
MKNILKIPFLVSCFFPVLLLAQNNYSIDPSKYQYSMTFTTTLNIEGQESNDTLDVIYAFVNGECRGKAHPIDYLHNHKRYVAFLMVYGNNIEDDTVTFTIYKSSKNIEYKLFNHVAFISNGSYGTPEKPLVNIVEEKLGAYNFFSPNSDGVNDTWQLLYNPLYYDFSVSIYNEIGEQLYFIKNNYKNDWDGKYKGSDIPNGTYYYYLMSPDKQRVYKGLFSLIR